MTRLPIGEPIREFPAGTWNRLVDMLESFQQVGDLSAVVDLMRGIAAADHAGMVIHVVNKTGADLVEFGVAGLDKPAFDIPTDDPADIADEVILGGVQFEVVPVDESLHESKFALTLEPIKNNESGRAYLPNATWARVDIRSESDEICGPSTSKDSHLESGKGGTPIVWKPSGTGIKWCIVQLAAGSGGGSPRRVLIASVTGGTWNPATESFTDGTATVFDFEWDEDQSRWEKGPSRTVKNALTSSITITPGWYVLGITLGDLLIRADCIEVPGKDVDLGA